MTAAWSSIPTPSSGPCARSLSVERTPCSPLRQRREALGNHRHPDPVGEAERCRSTGLADRRARTHRVRTDQAARIGHSAAMELESGCSCGNPRHHIASAFGRSPSIAVAAQLALTTQTPRLIRRTASRQRITHHPSQAMWGVCNAYAAKTAQADLGCFASQLAAAGLGNQPITAQVEAAALSFLGSQDPSELDSILAPYGFSDAEISALISAAEGNLPSLPADTIIEALNSEAASLYAAPEPCTALELTAGLSFIWLVRRRGPVRPRTTWPSCQ